MEHVSYSTFLTELDCLVDTRFSTLTTYGDDVFKNAFDENYYTRSIDLFHGIDFQEFKDRYKKRDKNILKNASGTQMVQMVQDFVKGTLSLIETSPHHFIPRILINTFPYILTDEEQTIILNSFVALTEQKAVVELVHLSKEELTPSFIKNEIALLAMYDYYEWLEIHSLNGKLKKTTCPEVTMIGPALYFKGKPTIQDIQATNAAKISAFRAMEITAGPLIGLKLFPIDLFSMALKLNKHKPT